MSDRKTSPLGLFEYGEGLARLAENLTHQQRRPDPHHAKQLEAYGPVLRPAQERGYAS